MSADDKTGRRSIFQWLFIAMSIVLTAVLLAAGGQKLLGTDQMVAIFSEIGLGQWLRVFTGIWGVAAAILLNFSVWRPVGAVMAVCLCVGAVITQAITGGSVAPSAVMLAMSILVAWLHRDQTEMFEVRGVLR